MAALPEQDRARTHAQAMRDRLHPPHWSKSAFRSAVNAIDDGLDALVATVASGLGIGAAQAARNMVDLGGLFALMSLTAYRTEVAALQASAETAAGSGFHDGSGVRSASLGRARFANLMSAIVRRRLGEYRAEED